MSILGYSASYFLPEYWANTPFYGEKIIPLLDYVLSTDFANSDKLASAFYMMENKYKNTPDLPLEALEAIIEESGYSYVQSLLGRDEESIRLLVYLLVLIHQLKGTKKGLEVVLNLLRRSVDPMTSSIIGELTRDPFENLSNFTEKDYLVYKGFTTDQGPFEIKVKFSLKPPFAEQCILSSDSYGLYLGISKEGKIVFSAGSNRQNFNIVDRELSKTMIQGNTWYYAKVSYDGYEYSVKLSEDDKKYFTYINVLSPEPTEIHQGRLYFGIDNSTGTPKSPFQGLLNISPLPVDVSNVIITQWFEQFPVDDENTFLVRADLDVNLVSTNFFANFANFVRRYVYPSLKAFEANLVFKNSLTIIPYSRQKITYIANGDLREFMRFYVKEFESSETSELQFTVMGKEEFEALLVVDKYNPT